MEVQFLNFYLGNKGIWGFSFLKALSDEVFRSFIELTYDTTNTKWSIYLLWYQVV